MKTVSQIVMGATAVALFTAVFENSMSIGTADTLYTLAGLTWLTLGTWLAYKVYKQECKCDAKDCSTK